MAGLGSLFIDLLARTGKFETDIGRAARVAERRSKQIQQSFDSVGRKIGAALGAYASIQTVQAIVRISDQYTQLRGRLALVTSGTEELGQVQQALFGIAQRTRTELSGVADLYVKLAQTGKELGASQQELLKFTEGVGNALTVSGSNAQQASGALLQLSQALAGGTVRAEEFNSIIEGAPEILRTVAANMEGMGGSVAKLRKAVLDGKVSSEDFFRAFLKGSDSLAARAQSMPVTVGQAFIRMQNNINQAISGSDMSPLVDAINDLSTAISDPSFQRDFASFVSGIVKLTAKSAGAVAETAGLARFIGEQISATLHGAASDDIARLEEELAKLQELRSMKWWDSGFLNRARVFGKGGLIEWYSDAELDAAITEIQGKIKNFYNPVATRPAIPIPIGDGGGRSLEREPSKEFVKISDKLKEQIALYGKVGKAAEIAYAIQSGALDELSGKEQQQLLALAKQYDAVVKVEDAKKKATEEQKKAQEEIKKMTQSLEEQVATFGMGETATLRYRVAHGELAKAFELAGENAEAMKMKLLDLTLELELMTEAANGAAEAISDFARQNTESLNQGLEAFEADFEKRFIKGIDKLTVFQEQAARNTQDIIADTLMNGFDKGVDGILKSFGEMIMKLVAQAIAADIAGKLFGEAGGGTGKGLLSGIFGGASGIVEGEHGWMDLIAKGWGWFGGGRAIGGPVLAGMTYRVNEREPEFFRPRVGGDIIPLSKMQGMGGGTVVNNHFTVRPENGDRVTRRTEQQIAAAASRAVAVASRRNN